MEKNPNNYSQIGAAVSMSILFHAPLFGIFEVEKIQMKILLP